MKFRQLRYVLCTAVTAAALAAASAAYTAAADDSRIEESVYDEEGGGQETDGDSDGSADYDTDEDTDFDMDSFPEYDMDVEGDDGSDDVYSFETDADDSVGEDEDFSDGEDDPENDGTDEEDLSGHKSTSFQTDNGVLHIEAPSADWVEMEDSGHWFAMTDGTNMITISHQRNGDKIPATEVANEKYGAVCQSFFSTPNEIFVVKGYAVRKKDLGMLISTIGTIRILKYDTKTAAQKDSSNDVSDSEQFKVYDMEGNSVTIFLIDDGTYQDSRGHIYEILEEGLYYDIVDDITYSTDPDYDGEVESDVENIDEEYYDGSEEDYTEDEYTDYDDGYDEESYSEDDAGYDEENYSEDDAAYSEDDGSDYSSDYE